MEHKSRIRLLRHATLLLEIAGKKVLIDPMFAPKDAYDPVPNSGNDIRIPMVDLPFGPDALKELVESVDAVVVTHLHPDHWDPVAQEMLPKDLPLFCQPEDVAAIQAQGFTEVSPVTGAVKWEGIEVVRTGGQHGMGEMAKMMGPVSGFVFEANGQRIYIAGDTLWCAEVEDAMDRHAAPVVVLNMGGAAFVEGGRITMTVEDLVALKAHSPEAHVIAVHTETMNHCRESRGDLSAAVSEKGWEDSVSIPADGEWLDI